MPNEPQKLQAPLTNRELSWLAFNERVLQEAADPTVPLFERLQFLAIFSSNLDEFFRVRVASLRTLLRVKKKKVAKLGFHPARLLQAIHREVGRQQERFGELFRGEILRELAEAGIELLDETRLTSEQAAFARRYFAEHLADRVEPVMLEEAAEPFLVNQGLYLVVELWPADGSPAVLAAEPRYALVEIPHGPDGRFVEVPAEDGRRAVLFVDDVLRCNLDVLFPEGEVGAAYAVKMTRDAELYLEDEFSGDLVAMIRKALAKRETGLPTRFLYDLRMPYPLVTFLKQTFGLEDEDLVLGGRYHNFHDFFGFPRFGLAEHSYAEQPPLPQPAFAASRSAFDVIAERDRLLCPPQQAFDPVVQFLDEAASDPHVERIWITLYRVARDSSISRALIRAAEAGKDVTAFVEVKARFDEATNIHWGDRMEAAGVRVLYSKPGLKVHAKLALVERHEGEVPRRYAYLGTGNFNERTARVYADLGLFTADPRLADEVRRVFAYLTEEDPDPTFEHLLVAPMHLRPAFERLIDREIAHAEAGRASGMTLKMNSLEDPAMCRRLYAASQAGVPVRLIVRGICCLQPGVPGLSERIEATSIIDRYLEHSRVYRFHNDGNEALYLASADWMTRNLDRRVEVAFPLYDPDVRAQVDAMLRLQTSDTQKARVLDAEQTNAYVQRAEPAVRAQEAFYAYLEERAAAVSTGSRTGR